MKVDKASTSARYYISSIDKRGNLVFKMNAKYVQYLVNQSKDGNVYFVTGGDPGSKRSQFLMSALDPTRVNDAGLLFYNIGTAICPEPSPCDFPLPQKDTTILAPH